MGLLKYGAPIGKLGVVAGTLSSLAALPSIMSASSNSTTYGKTELGQFDKNGRFDNDRCNYKVPKSLMVDWWGPEDKIDPRFLWGGKDISNSYGIIAVGKKGWCETDKEKLLDEILKGNKVTGISWMGRVNGGPNGKSSLILTMNYKKNWGTKWENKKLRKGGQEEAWPSHVLMCLGEDSDLKVAGNKKVKGINSLHNESNGKCEKPSQEKSKKYIERDKNWKNGKYDEKRNVKKLLKDKFEICWWDDLIWLTKQKIR